MDRGREGYVLHTREVGGAAACRGRAWVWGSLEAKGLN